MPDSPPVVRMPEGLDLPPGYQEVVIEKGKNAGRYAVRPKPKCRWCITGDPGYMSTVVPGEKKPRRSPCSCILAGVVEFLGPKHLQPGRLVPAAKPGGKSALELQVERIDEVIAQKQRYVDERTKVIEALKVERDEAVAKIKAEVEQVLADEAELQDEHESLLIMAADEAELQDEHESLLIMAESCAERIEELRAEAKDLAHRAEHLEANLADLDADEARDRVRTTEVEYQGAIDLAKGDGRYRRYQADVERLRARREKLVPPLSHPVTAGGEAADA